MVLMDASAPVRDRRIAGVLENILGDDTKPSLVRQAAAVVLANYVLKRFRGVVKKGPLRGDQWWIDPVEVSRVASDDGSEPLDAGFRNRVIALIERAHASAPPERGMMYPLTNLLLTMLREGEELRVLLSEPWRMDGASRR
jgi:DNA helicase HerA-like ATPase